MARVYPLREVSQDVPEGEWQLCFQWCRYVYNNGSMQMGYRFIWRRPENRNLQAARGQARIPSLAVLDDLIGRARNEGWGDLSGD